MNCELKMFCSLRFYFFIFLFFLFPTLSTAKTEQLQSCMTEASELILIKKFNKCEALLDAKSLSPRERAHILMYVGIAKSLESEFEPDPSAFESDIFKHWREAISIDPTYSEIYLVWADWYAIREKSLDELAIIDKGLEVNPFDEQLLVKKASLSFEKGDKTAALKVCDQLSKSKASNYDILQNCGLLFFKAGDDKRGMQLFALAFSDHKKNGSIKTGLTLKNAPQLTLARYLSEQKNMYEEAANLLEIYYSSYPEELNYHFSLISLAETQEKAGRFASAASTYQKAIQISRNSLASIPTEDVPLTFKVLINLAKAGQYIEAKKYWTNISSKLSKKQILQLQVLLKNGTQKQLAINGNNDDAMQDAVLSCLKDPDCFKGVFGKTL